MLNINQFNLKPRMEIESDDHLYGKNFQNSYMHLLTFQISGVFQMKNACGTGDVKSFGKW